ncbi:tandem-95 repeat protein [uncultured Pseudodesulfovibrio sp.]|uniref:tandem-95 repeat protein n=1 Tax=uncultured Pseudodesulfovibrio sp. TaxID=2035858 RepID=UPI0029C61DB9|nr:Ig-like domain-containing protein [uncultured Pseudodesulfovibrio sp.]
MADPKTQVLQVSLPGAGQTTSYQLSAGVPVKFTFDISEAVFNGSNGNLTIAIEGGGTVVLENYQALAAAESMPVFEMLNGEQVAGDVYLFAFADGADSSDGELETAADGANGGSGAGEYSDDPGQIGDGVDALGGQDDAYASRSLSTAVGIDGNHAPVANDDFNEITEVGDDDFNANEHVSFVSGGDQMDGESPEGDSFSLGSNGDGFVINYPNDAPQEQEPVAGNLIDNDFDPDSAHTNDSLMMHSIDYDGVDFNGQNPGPVEIPAEGHTIEGLYGTLVIQPDGSYTYTLNEDLADSLEEGETFDEVFNYTIEDPVGAVSNQASLTITVHGSNDAPTAVVDTNVQAIEHGDSTGYQLPDGYPAPDGHEIDAAPGNALVAIDGDSYGTEILSGVDDGSFFVDTSAAFADGLNFFGNTYGGIYVSTNGYITFGEGETSCSFNSSDLSYEPPFIAAQYDDFNPAKGGHIYYDVDAENGVVTITWEDLQEWGNSSGDDNSFQIRLHDLGNGDFDVEIRYANTDWADGNSTGGWSAGDGVNFEIPLSGAEDVLNAEDSSNIGHDGVYGWTVRDGQVTGELHDYTTAVAASGNVLENDSDVDDNDMVFEAGEESGLFVMGAYSAHPSDNIDDQLDYDASLVNGELDGVVEPSQTSFTVQGHYGTLTINSDGSYTYTLDNDGNNADLEGLNYNNPGTDSFTYAIMDDSGALDYANITFTVNGANDAPEAFSDINSIQEFGYIFEETSYSGIATGNVITDVNGDDQVDTDADDAQIFVESISHGENTQAVYDYDDTNEYVEIDGDYGTLKVWENGEYEYTLDNDNETVDALDDGGKLTETFSYTTTNSWQDGVSSNAADLTITIHGTNDAPVAVNDVDTASEAVDDAALVPASGNVITDAVTGDSDVDTGDVLHITEVQYGTESVTTFDTEGNLTIVGTYGTLTIDADGEYSYVADLEAANRLDSGSDPVDDVFTYTVSDGDVPVTATLTISVSGVNDTPVAVNDVNTASEAVDDAALVPATGNVITDAVTGDSDVDTGDVLHITEVQYGTESVTTFDTEGNLTIVGTYGTLTIDADGEYSYVADQEAANRLDSGSDPVDDVFTYTVSDGDATTTATLTISVSGVNDAPEAVGNHYGEFEPGFTATFEATDVNVSGNQLSVTDGGITVSANMIYSFADGAVEVRNEPYFNLDLTTKGGGLGISGRDDLNGGEVSLRDGDDWYDQADEGLVVDLGDNAAPTVTIELGLLFQNGPDGNYTEVARVIAFDADGNKISDQNVSGSTNGNVTVELDGGTVDIAQVIVLPVDNGAGMVGNNSDFVLNSVTAEKPDYYEFLEDGGDITLAATSADGSGILDNDFDIDGDSLEIVLFEDGTHPVVGGTVSVDANGNVVFSPEQDFNSEQNGGDASFWYRAFDGEKYSDPVEVTIKIGAVNDAPDAGGDSFATLEDTSLNLDVLVNDIDMDGDNLTIVSEADSDNNVDAPSAANGSVEIVLVNGEQQLHYTPDTDFNGQDTITYSVSDGNGGFDTTTVTVNVGPVNDAPVAAKDAKTVTEPNDDGASISVTDNVLTNDHDPDNFDNNPNDDPASLVSVTYAGAEHVFNANGDDISFGTEYGTVTFTQQGDYTFTANNDTQAAGFNPEEVFTYVMQDSDGVTSSSILTVTVNGVNDAPTLDLSAGTVTFEGHTASYHNMIGVYEMSNGKPVNPEIILEDVQDANIGDVLTTFGDGQDLHYFLVDVGGGSTPTGTPEFVWDEANGEWDITFDGGATTKNVHFDDMSLNPNDHGESTFGDNPNHDYEVEVDDQLVAGHKTSGDDDDYDDVLADEHPGMDGSDHGATFTEGDAPVSVTGAVDISDIDSETISKVEITYTPEEFDDLNIDLGSFIDGGTVTNPDGSVTWTISGEASKGDYEDLLQSLTFENNSEALQDGTREITIRVNDGEDWSNPAQSTITVVGVNDAPVAFDESIDSTHVVPGASDTFNASDMNLNGATATMAGITVAGAAVYHPNHAQDYSANLSQTEHGIGVNDGRYDAYNNEVDSERNYPGWDESLTVTLDAPRDSVTIDLGLFFNNSSETEQARLIAYDADGKQIGEPVVVTGEADGSVTSPALGEDGSKVATVTITPVGDQSDFTLVAVHAVDHPTEVPNWVEDQVDPIVFSVADILANDTDADHADYGDGDSTSLSISEITGANGGTAELSADGTQIIFHADPNHNGETSFTYTVEDPLGAVSNEATTTFEIGAVNDAPVAINDSYHGLVVETHTDVVTNWSAAEDLPSYTTNGMTFTAKSQGDSSVWLESMDRGDDLGVDNGTTDNSDLIDSSGQRDSILVDFAEGKDSVTIELGYWDDYDDARIYINGVNHGRYSGDSSSLTLTAAAHNGGELIESIEIMAVKHGSLNSYFTLDSIEASTYSLSGEAGASGDVLANDFNVDAGDTLSVIGVNGHVVNETGSTEIQGEHGVLTIHADGSYDYALDDGWQSLDHTVTETFEYTVSDSHGVTDVADLEIPIHVNANVVTDTSTDAMTGEHVMHGSVGEDLIYIAPDADMVDLSAGGHDTIFIDPDYIGHAGGDITVSGFGEGDELVLNDMGQMFLSVEQVTTSTGVDTILTINDGAGDINPADDYTITLADYSLHGVDQIDLPIGHMDISSDHESLNSLIQTIIDSPDKN